MEKIIQEAVFEAITNPDVEETGRTFSEKEVAVIMGVVSIMVGDPKPGDNETLYRRLMDSLNLSESLHVHMLTMILSARKALKDALRMQAMEHSKSSTPTLKEIEDFLKSIKDC